MNTIISQLIQLRYVAFLLLFLQSSSSLCSGFLVADQRIGRLPETVPSHPVKTSHVPSTTATRTTPSSTFSSSSSPLLSSRTALRVVADIPIEGEKKRGKRNNDDDDDDGNEHDKDSRDWIPSKSGGFIPNIKSHLIWSKNRDADTKPSSPGTGRTDTAYSSSSSSAPRRKKPSRSPPPVLQVTDIGQYKTEVVDVQDRMVCVRFYAPWCRACKAVEGSFRRLQREFPDVKFVEVPVTKENAYLHRGLGVPSLPFAHLYDPSVGLVEERKINKNVFGEFKNILGTYADGMCDVTYNGDGSTNFQ